jgi:hypothetical protein
VTDPAQSIYDKTPLDPNAKSDAKPEDVGNHQTPELAVWDYRPSFNLDPIPIIKQGSGPPNGDASDVEAFAVNLDNIATEVNSMLETSRGLVHAYEDLKSKVMATEGTAFGQQAVTSAKTDKESSAYLAPNQGANAANDYIHGDKHFPVPYAEQAKAFAAQMNPAQEKVLQRIGTTLELVGEYIARVNNAGQTYGYGDRKSKFPDPPSSA